MSKHSKKQVIQSAPDTRIAGSVYGNLIVAGRDAIVTWVAQVPMWALVSTAVGTVAAVLTLIVSVAPIVDLLPAAPEPPNCDPYEMCVAVANFAVPADGSVGVVEADALTEQFYGRLANELDSFDDDIGIMTGILGPDVVGRIEGSSREDRRTNASQLAYQLEADIVVYGVITRNDYYYEVQPEFYVMPDSFEDALEMTGTFRLGRAIEIDSLGGDPRSAYNVNQPLSARTESLAYIVQGLGHYTLEDYESALEEFDSADELLDWDETGGREVLHLLKGNTQLRLASEGAFRADADTLDERLGYAASEYENAIAVAPEYSRAYRGLASVSYLTGLAPTYRGADADLAAFEQALVYLEQADAATDQPDKGIRTRGVLIQTQAQFALWTFGGEHYTDEELGALYQEFTSGIDLVVRVYEDGNTPYVEHLAAEAYTLRGLAAHMTGQCREALEAYDSSLGVYTADTDQVSAGGSGYDGILALPTTSHRMMFVLGWKGDCHRELGQLAEAADAYDEAMNFAERVDDENMVAQFKHLRDETDALLQEQQ